MSLKSLSLILATTAVAALTLPALAQDKSGANVGAAAEGAAPGAASTMGLAQELYALGVAQGDAVTVLAAAKLAASVEVKTAEAGALDPAKVTFGEGVDETTFRKKAAPGLLTEAVKAAMATLLLAPYRALLPRLQTWAAPPATTA